MVPTRTLLTTLSAILAVTALALPTTAGALDLDAAPSTPLDAVDETAPAAAPTWAPLSSATIRPGVQMNTGGSQCTSNFVFYDATDIYLGYAAHCAGTGGSTSTNGCTTGSRALGTKVSIQGASRQGTLAYSAWRAMQAAGENPNSEACRYNDFALVKLHPADHGRVNPSVLHFGGPTGLCDNPRVTGEEVISYGNSGLRFGFDPVAPKDGVTLFRTAGAWSSTVYMASPGVPGDSGSGYMMADSHCAWGVTSTIALAPYAASNGISSVKLGLQYAASHGGPSVTLATAAPITSLPV